MFSTRGPRALGRDSVGTAHTVYVLLAVLCTTEKGPAYTIDMSRFNGGKLNRVIPSYLLHFLSVAFAMEALYCAVYSGI